MRFSIIATFLLFLLNSFFNTADAQEAKPEPSILIKNAIIHDGRGKVLSNYSLGIRNQKIAFIGTSTEADNSGQWDEIIDAAGKHLYPGIIALNTTIGLNEIEAVRATNDYNETGWLNPGARSLIAYNTDSRVSPTVRSNGVLLTQVTPTGGIVSGTSSVMKLDGWNWEDAVYKADNSLHVRWPSARVWKSEWAGPEDKQKERYQNNLKQIQSLFEDAYAYHQQKNTTEKNLNLEAIRGVFNGSKKLYIHCNYVKDIVNAVNFFSKYPVQQVIVGGEDAWLVSKLLKDKNIPVVLVKTHNLPAREDEEVNLPYSLPKMLKDAGLEFCITVDEFWQVRNIAYHAGTAAAHGLTKEEALQTITYNAAKILGIESSTGSLELGKDATLLLVENDLLDMSKSKISEAMILGKRVSLDNSQEQLFRKFSEKYNWK
jgi:imidazolonepropionase-like amidohydrolase